MKRRGVAKQTVTSMRDGILTAGRVAKAYPLARMPPHLAEEDRRPDLSDYEISMAYTMTAFEDAAVTEERYRTIFEVLGWPAVDVWPPDALLSRLEDEEQVRVLQGAVASKRRVRLAVARDAEPIELRTLDPRAYAISSDPDDIWFGRTRCADAFAVSSFLGHLLQRLKQNHPAYRPASAPHSDRAPACVPG